MGEQSKLFYATRLCLQDEQHVVRSEVTSHQEHASAERSLYQKKLAYCQWTVRQLTSHLARNTHRNRQVIRHNTAAAVALLVVQHQQLSALVETPQSYKSAVCGIYC